MTKYSLVLAALFGACTTGQLMCMETKSLTFYVDSKRRIETHRKNGMDFAVKPKKFEGKDLLEIIDLKKCEKKKLKKAFKKAVKKGHAQQSAEYTFEKKRFVALIKAMEGGKKSHFIVEVQPQ